MKYELKRNTKRNIIFDSAIIAVSIVFVVLTKGENPVCVFLALMGGGVLVNEIVRSKDPTLIFDETGFYIGERRISYNQIERVSSHRDRNVTYAKIIVDGEEVYKFDTSYENVGEFIKQLTLSGVEHKLYR